MAYEIEFATQDDEQRLEEIFLNAGMDLVGDTEDHIVIRKDGQLQGGALLYQADSELFHLLTIAIKQDERSTGTGSQILQQILKEPWKHCINSEIVTAPNYRVTTVSRGESRNFYLKNGMTDCDFDSLVPPFDTQCHSCPDTGTCHSAALDYQGVKMESSHGL